MDQQPSTASPLDWITCSHCHSSPSTSASSLWLNSCTHVTCATCLFPVPAASPSASNSPASATCPACGNEGTVISLEAALQHPDLAHCFRPLATLAQELGMAADWQMGRLRDELGYFKDKCAEQKVVLGKVAGEVRQLEGLRSQAEQLASENAFLRSQLASTQGQSQSAASSSATHQQQEKAYYSADGGSRGLKRRAGRSPDRHAIPLQPATAARAPSRSASTALMNLPLPPSRLSFTPAQSQMAQQRGKASSRQGSFAGPLGAAPGNENVRMRLAQFAYDPSRTRQHPPAASAAPTGRAYSDPAAGPSQSRSSSRLRLNQREQYAFNEGQSQSREQHQQNLRPDQQVPPHSSPGSSPFLFHPPSMENAVHHSHRQQQHIPRTMSRLSQYEQEDQLMPPPPVPAELRRSQQQVGRPSPFVTPRELDHDQQQPRGTLSNAQYAPHPGTPVPRTYTPIPSSTHGFHPPPPSTTPFGTSAGASHRKPFRPATGGGGGGMGGGFRYG